MSATDTARTAGTRTPSGFLLGSRGEVRGVVGWEARVLSRSRSCVATDCTTEVTPGHVRCPAHTPEPEAA